jgi:hypothetical protein
MRSPLMNAIGTQMLRRALQATAGRLALLQLSSLLPATVATSSCEAIASLSESICAAGGPPSVTTDAQGRRHARRARRVDKYLHQILYAANQTQSVTHAAAQTRPALLAAAHPSRAHPRAPASFSSSSTPPHLSAHPSSPATLWSALALARRFFSGGSRTQCPTTQRAFSSDRKTFTEDHFDKHYR